MKRIFAFMLASVVIFLLGGCGKSEQVKQLESMIDSIGEVTLEDRALLQEIEEFGSSIPEKELSQVENISVYYAAYDRINELLKEPYLGDWIIFGRLANDDSSNSFDGSQKITLTSNEVIYGSGYQWAVDPDRDNLFCLWNEGAEFGIEGKVCEVKGARIIPVWSGFLVKAEDYDVFLSEIVKIVELTPENVGDYLDFKRVQTEYYDAFGDKDKNETRKTSSWIISKLYEEGWLYFRGENFKIELLKKDGWGSKSSEVIQWGPFGQFWLDDKGKVEFGRAEGTLYFIAADLVEVVNNDAEKTHTLKFGDAEFYPDCGDTGRDNVLEDESVRLF